MPSRKFIITIFTAIFLGLLVWGLSLLFKSESRFERDEVVSANKTISESFADVDSDEDGLKDWEEALWQTDPLVADSDGDGLSDYEEVERKRKEIQSDSEYEELGEPETETDLFARQFLSTVATLNQQGTLDQAGVEDFSRGISSVIENTKIQDKYSLVDLKILSTTPQDYNNSLKEAFINSGLYNIDKSESQVIAEFIKNNGSKESMEDINSLIVAYAKFSDSIVNIRVPYSVSGPHLLLANSANRISKALASVKYINEDPIRSISGIQDYRDGSENLTNAISSISIYLKSNGIIN